VQDQLQLDPRAALEQRVLDVLEGKHGAYPLPEEARAILRVLRFHAGWERAIPLCELAERAAAASVHAAGITDREVKQAVKTLTEDFGVPVGASRQTPNGYFLCVTREDLEIAVRPYILEGKSLFRRARAIAGNDVVEAALGQLRLELGKDDAA